MFAPVFLLVAATCMVTRVMANVSPRVSLVADGYTTPLNISLMPGAIDELESHSILLPGLAALGNGTFNASNIDVELELQKWCVLLKYRPKQSPLRSRHLWAFTYLLLIPHICSQG